MMLCVPTFQVKQLGLCFALGLSFFACKVSVEWPMDPSIRPTSHEVMDVGQLQRSL